MMLIIRELLEGVLEPTEELAAHLYECLLCKGCDAVCAGRDVLPLGQLECATIFRALRADLVELGLAPPPAVKKVTDAIADKHNRQGTAKNRNEWAEGLNIPSKGKTVLFAGCTSAYQDHGSVQSLAKILKKAKLDFGILDDEWCCGALQIDSGRLEDFKASAEHNVKAVRDAGAKELVVGCADCYRTLKYDYPEVVGDLGFDVIHSSELILRLLNDKKIKTDKKLDFGGKATYFDPCLLSRVSVVSKNNGVTEPPRAVLGAIPGTEWVEMDGFGRYTYCCGRPIAASSSPQIYQQTGRDRVEDALAVDAKAIVTGCVNCKMSLTSASKKMNAEIRVLDFAEAVAQALSE
jgi:heterodisulfide reductase subunit D